MYGTAVWYGNWRGELYCYKSCERSSEVDVDAWSVDLVVGQNKGGAFRNVQLAARLSCWSLACGTGGGGLRGSTRCCDAFEPGEEVSLD